MILVDTCVWSEALRKKKNVNREAVEKLTNMIRENQVAMIGPIRQEILSGVTNKKVFLDLQEKLRFFPDIVFTENNYELAAEYFNLCRRKGVQGSNTDFLICSISICHDLPIFTFDKDFLNFKKIFKLKLYS